MKTRDSSEPPNSVRARNRAAILEGGRRLFAKNPDASIGDVAAAAGVVRRTLYGHFANRSELIKALVDMGAGELIEILGSHDLDDRHAAEEMATVVLRIWPVAQAFWPLVSLAQQVIPQEVERSMRPFHQRVARIIAKGQDAGVFATHLEPDMLAVVVDAIALSHLRAGAKLGWKGDERDVATAALIALGVPQKEAERTTTKCGGQR